MDKIQEFRKNAEKCSEIAEITENGPKKKRFERLAEGWNSLATNQAWLDGKQEGPDPSEKGPET